MDSKCDDDQCNLPAGWEIRRAYGPTPHIYACDEHLGQAIVWYASGDGSAVLLLVERLTYVMILQGGDHSGL